MGTYVFAAVERLSNNARLRWNVVSLRGGHAPSGTVEPKDRTRVNVTLNVEPVPTDADDPKAALDRIAIPQDVLDRIAGIAPRSSLIVTDEPPSSETGKGTEFVVLLSGEPQGGIKRRRRSPGSESRYARPRSQLLGLAFRKSLSELVSARRMLSRWGGRPVDPKRTAGISIPPAVRCPERACPAPERTAPRVVRASCSNASRPMCSTGDIHGVLRQFSARSLTAGSDLVQREDVPDFLRHLQQGPEIAGNGNGIGRALAVPGKYVGPAARGCNDKPPE